MTIDRRTFLASVAAVPIALTGRASRPRVIVVGAGAFGGWTALQLLRRGAEVLLLDAWGAGNARSSSGGETRVIRAVYGADRIYSAMVRRAYEHWEALDPALYTETGALWMHRGADDYVRSAAPILRELSFPLDALPLGEARRRYPQIDFRGVQSVWLERRAGALAARRACMAVRNAVEKAGGTYRIAHAELSGDALRLGDGSRLEADAYVFACGPWLGKLFPETAIQPTRQEVHYFGIPRGSRRFGPEAMPVWIDFGERIVYGLPDLDGRGFKVADDTRGEPVDPTNLNRTPSPESIARARKLLAERFPELADAPLLESRVCQYENSPDGHLVLDRHPQAKKVWIAGGGSGHGFKLAPAVGEMLADAIITEAKLPEMFGIARLAKLAKPTTQFDR
ncbi:MAG TPA: FAD-dependent oxidoreductase [Thermoanaerobaculia bacterium]|jgi:glycine/D-amino acid oxidase-like deaminating enzyme